MYMTFYDLALKSTQCNFCHILLLEKVVGPFTHNGGRHRYCLSITGYYYWKYSIYSKFFKMLHFWSRITLHIATKCFGKLSELVKYLKLVWNFRSQNSTSHIYIWESQWPEGQNYTSLDQKSRRQTDRLGEQGLNQI